MVTQRTTTTTSGDRESPEALEHAPDPEDRDDWAGWRTGQWRWLLPITVSAATLAWVLGALSGRAHGELRVGLIVTGAVLTAIAVGLPLRQRHHATHARADALDTVQAARTAMRIALQDALDPFVHLMTRLPEAKAADRDRLRGEAIQLAVTTTAALAGAERAERVRVCFFVLDPGPPQTLRLERFAGRAGAPTVVFTEGSAAGDAALRVVHQGSWIYVEDTQQQRPRFTWDIAPVYRTVLAGPVATPDSAYGLLTLDALRPGELARVDLALVQLLAGLLAAALAL